MSKVEQALKSAIEAFELHAEQYPYMVKGYCVDALEDCQYIKQAGIVDAGCDGCREKEKK